MAQRSDEIKQDIEETREQMGATIDALAYKADVPTRTKEWVGEKKDALTSRLGGAGSKVGDATPDRDEMRRAASSLKSTAERNPLGLAIGGAAVGFIAGLFTPSTRMEDERIGPLADDVKASAAEAGREAVESGRQVAQETAQTALETARERVREEGDELSTSLQDKAREAVATEDQPSEPASTSVPKRTRSQKPPSS
jgi:gas vesicle protein